MSKRCCYRCVYATYSSGCLWVCNAPMGWASHLICVNHVDCPGQPREILPTSVCRNFRARREPPVWTKPPEPPDESIRYIALTQGQFAIVSAADYEWLSQWKWHAAQKGCAGEFYAKRHENGRSIWMHREIVHAPPDKLVDHIDGNGLNNYPTNLRLCNRKQNSRNRRPNRNSKTGFKGVWYDKRTGRCYSQIRYKGKNLYLGVYDTPVEAARAYDHKALELYGEFARLNFPQEHEKPEAEPPAEGGEG
ncbi:MAG: HNH endonuclease [Sedimentisphaerales bacterium]|nr:HNH endonuclease [Sedimentisphaerales bacterium]